MPSESARRNVLVLTLCQALGMTAVVIMVTVSALTGAMLADDRTFATLPLSLQYLSTMLATIPASLLMKQVGRRAGFSIGALFGVAAGTFSVVAVVVGSFWLFCLGNALIGIAQGFGMFYRFAAADAADDAFRPKAISLVLSGGVAAAIVGPELAKLSSDLIEGTRFAGCFAVIAGLAGIAFLLLQFIDIPRPSAAERRTAGRPLTGIASQPAFIVAALAGMVGYATMTLVMTATPLAMQDHNHAFNDTAFVIQWHVLAMFAPSFVTGDLIRRAGLLNTLLAGTALLAASVGVNLAGTGLVEFWLAMVLLGLGWNFLYIGATTLLTEAYQPAERAKVQALNDFLIFGLVTVSSFSSGALQGHLGWQVVNIVAVPPILAVFAAVLWLRARRAAVA